MFERLFSEAAAMLTARSTMSVTAVDAAEMVRPGSVLDSRIVLGPYGESLSDARSG